MKKEKIEKPEVKTESKVVETKVEKGSASMGSIFFAFPNTLVIEVIADLLMIPAGGATTPASAATIDARMHYVKQDGRAVFKHAVTRISQVIVELLDGHGLTADDVDIVVPHQANIRIIEATARKLHLPPERVVVTVQDHGNTSAASVPLALDTAVRDGRIQRGDNLLLEAFGGGFTWGSALIRY